LNCQPRKADLLPTFGYIITNGSRWLNPWESSPHGRGKLKIPLGKEPCMQTLGNGTCVAVWHANACITIIKGDPN
jgi:hypothetical protein